MQRVDPRRIEKIGAQFFASQILPELRKLPEK
jgi:hypothetical protein